MAKAKKEKAVKGKFKSAVTGRFVKAAKAATSPKTTYKIGKKKTSKKGTGK